MATHPDFRGKGLISNLSKLVYKDVEKSGASMSIGFSNEEGVQVDKHSTNYGYHIIGKFETYYHIVTQRKKTNCTLSKISSFKETVLQQKDFYSINKTVKYLDWRYKDNPNHDYLFYEAKMEDKFIGYVVLKKSKLKTRVVDVICPDDSTTTTRNIITAINNLALTDGKRLTTFSVLDNKFWHSVFNKTLSFKKTLKKNSYYLTIKIHNTKLFNEEELLNVDNWLCFSGDIL
jgi:hypothetical protein